MASQRKADSDDLRSFVFRVRDRVRDRLIQHLREDRNLNHEEGREVSKGIAIDAVEKVLGDHFDGNPPQLQRVNEQSLVDQCFEQGKRMISIQS